DRALPFLDQARASERDRAAAAIRRDRRRSGRRNRRESGRQRESVEQSRLDRRGGGGDEADQAADGGGQKDSDCRYSAALGLHGADEARLSDEYADAVRWRRQYADAGIQVVPCESRKGLGG